jgi:hypothetical protein
MKFEEWHDFGIHNESRCRDMYEDWDAERNQYIAELSACKERVKRLEHDLEIVYSIDTEAQKAIEEAQEQTKEAEGMNTQDCIMQAKRVWGELFTQYRYTGKEPGAFVAQMNIDLDIIAAYGQEQRRVVLERVRDWIRNNSMPGLSDHTALIHREKFERFIEGLLAEWEKI